MKSIYDVLKEKEAQLQQLQRLLNEAQTVLDRVLELDAAVSGTSRALPAEGPSSGEGSRGGTPDGDSHTSQAPANGWGSNGSTEFP